MANEVEDRLYAALGETKIPDYMWTGLVEYIVQGRPTGDFLYAILTNDFKKACYHADDANRTALYDYGSFLFNYAPVVCWGSVQRVHDWMNKHTVTMTRMAK
jgi:hypothetical protein